MIPARALSEGRAAELRTGPSDVLYEIAMGPIVGHELTTNLTTWDATHRFVALADLSLEERLRYFPTFAEQWRVLDRAAREGISVRLDPLARVLQKAPLLLARTIDPQGDYRIVQVGFAAGEGAGSFFFRMRRAGHELARIEGPVAALREAISPPLDPAAAADTERLLDRILTAASEGLVSSRAVTLAFYLAETRDGAHWAASVVTAREGDPIRAAALVRTLREAEAAGKRTTEVPGFGTAHRETLAAFVLTMPEHDLDVVIGGHHQLEVPSAPMWVVAAPPPPSAISAYPSAPPPRANVKGAERRALRIVLGILGVLAIAAALGHFRGRGFGDACEAPSLCRSKVCLTPAMYLGAGYCSKYCTESKDCPSDYACVDVAENKRACMFGK